MGQLRSYSEANENNQKQIDFQKIHKTKHNSRTKDSQIIVSYFKRPTRGQLYLKDNNNLFLFIIKADRE